MIAALDRVDPVLGWPRVAVFVGCALGLKGYDRAPVDELAHLQRGHPALARIVRRWWAEEQRT